MNEPRRLLDDAGSDIERALLQAGSRYACPDGQREKVLASLGLLGVAGIGSTIASWSLRHALDAGAAKWLAGLSVVGLAAAAPVGFSAWNNSHSEPVVPRIEGGLVAIHVPRVEAATRTEPADPALEAGDMMDVSDSTPSRPMARRVSARPGLAKELEALDQARGLLASGQGSAALARLARYSTDHPRGRLGLEAEVLRIDALFAVGRHAEATSRAEVFLRRHSNSVLAARVRRHLGE